MAAKKEDSQSQDSLSVAAGARVQQLRAERDMGPSQLAALAGMDPNYLWRIEAGRQNLSLRNVARLAKALGITMSTLLEGVEVSHLELGNRPYTRKTDQP